VTWPAQPSDPGSGPPPGPDPFGTPSVTPPVSRPELPSSPWIPPGTEGGPSESESPLPSPVVEPPSQPFVTQPAAPTAPAGPREAWLPRPYPQLLRGPTFRWWRPLASLGVAALTVGVVLALVIGGGVVYYLVTSAPTGAGTAPSGAPSDTFDTSPGGMLLTNLVLAALIPVAMVAVWAAFGWRPRWMASVVGGVRWGWLGLTTGISLLCVLPSLVLGVVTDDVSSWTPEPQWPALALVVALTTPLQAAGEEYAFRGWVPLVLGSIFRDPRVGAVLGGLVATTLFGLAHGQQDPWLFADRFVFGAVACWLVWRTGGLEAGIALHAVNNLSVFALTIAQGSLQDAISVSEASPGSVLLDVGTLVVTAVVIDQVARRRGVARLFTPPLTGAPADPAVA
jgi:membrane protease YdiL (CAAX protease family)